MNATPSHVTEPNYYTASFIVVKYQDDTYQTQKYKQLLTHTYATHTYPIDTNITSYDHPFWDNIYLSMRKNDITICRDGRWVLPSDGPHPKLCRKYVKSVIDFLEIGVGQIEYAKLKSYAWSPKL